MPRRKSNAPPADVLETPEVTETPLAGDTLETPEVTETPLAGDMLETPEVTDASQALETPEPPEPPAPEILSERERGLRRDPAYDPNPPDEPDDPATRVRGLKDVEATLRWLIARNAETDKRARQAIRALQKAVRKVDDGPKRETNLTRRVTVTQEMAEFLGVEECMAARTDIIKAVSRHAVHNNLKLPSDRRIIVLDAALAALLGLDVGAHVRFCDVQKHIKGHIVPVV